MRQGKREVEWEMLSWVLAQISNMRAWVFRTDKHAFTPADWNPLTTKAAPPAEEPGPDGLTNGMLQLKTLVLAGKFGPKR